MSFERRIEDFTCEKCGTAVTGDGYTNHCPQCLHSKHVDINPGDRAATCGGLMEPVAVEGSTGEGYKIRHRCVQCGHEFRVSVASNDSQAVLIEIALAHRL